MKNIHQKVALFYLVLFISLILLLGACTAKYEWEAAHIASDSAYDLITATPTSLKITLQPTPYISTPSRTPQSNTLKPKNTELQGCVVPSDDYSRLEINGHQLNHRTYKMLAQAQTVYDGEINFTGEAITQGSYTNAVGASFGTHAGGGAVDLSVMQPGTYTILYSDIEKIIQALRITGFAAWYRDFDALYPGSPPHIHAIAIGDRELSMPAREQLAGPHGYFWGFNGLPVKDGLPARDPHGGPVICNWMVKLGYPNKTSTPSPAEYTPQPDRNTDY